MTQEQIIAAILKWPCLYETKDGMRFYGCPVSELPKQLRSVGWRNVSRDFSYAGELEARGLRVVTARYVGGVRPKRFCDVVLAQHYGFNPAFHAFMMEQGATHEHLEDCFEDIGDAENGPKLAGHPALDVYTLDGIDYAVGADGIVERSETVPFDTQGIECDAVSR